MRFATHWAGKSLLMPLKQLVSRVMRLGFFTSALLVLGACVDSVAVDQTQVPSSDSTSIVVEPARTASQAESPAPSARVTGVDVRGEPGAYTFAVTIESPDTGCAQYADWWEVVSGDGEKLLYRRVLLHSHIDEQPFTRSGGLVDIGLDDVVAVRAHMNSTGYGAVLMLGSVSGGFEEADGQSFAPALESEDPLPTSCAF